MVQTGSQILSYTGDKDLGQGANADIPVISPNTNLEIINQTARDIGLMNHATNLKLYQQKINDRDATLQMLADGQVSSGKLDPNDRKVYDEAKKKVQDNFYKMVQNGGLNNPDAVRTYKDSVSNLKNIADWGQSRDIELAKLQAEKATQTLPEDIAAYDKHIKAQQSKEFWQPIDPFQKAFNYDIDTSTANVLGEPVTERSLGTTNAQPQMGVTRQNTITDRNGVVAKTSTEKLSPLKSALVTKPRGKGVEVSETQVNPDGTFSEISYTPEKYWDFETIQKNVAEQAASNPTERNAYQSYLNDFTNDNKLPIDQQLSTLKAYNNRIADYSEQRGIAAIGTNEDGTPKYPDQIKYYQDPVSKRILIQETPESFFAKHALASVKGDYVEKPKAILNEAAAKLNILKQKANADEFYKHAMAGAANTKARAYADNLKQQMKMRKDTADQDNFLNEIYTRNLLQQPSLIGAGKKENDFNFAPIKASNSLPIFTISGNKAVQLQPIGAEAVTDPISGKFLYWEGGTYNVQYMRDGKPLTQSEITKAYSKFKEDVGSKWNGSLSDWLKESIRQKDKKGEPLMDFVLQGANGATDRELSNAAQRIISNAATKKGQTSVFNDEQPPTDEQIPDNNE